MKERKYSDDAAKIDQDTLSNLGPLRAMAGLFISQEGRDSLRVDGHEELTQYRDEFVSSPVDPQIVGERVLYALRYLQYARRHGSVQMLDDQVGYWLWDQAASSVTLTRSTPRGDVVVATGICDANATSFTVRSVAESNANGVSLRRAQSPDQRTVSFEMTVTTVNDDSWSYVQEISEQVAGRKDADLQRREATLVRVSHAPANPSKQLP